MTPEQARAQAGRGRERLHRVKLTGFAALAARGLNVAAGLLTIPLAARHLGTERFGLWLLLASFLSWVSLADLGIANTLTTELARADGRGDRDAARALVSSAVYPLLLLAAAIVLAILAASPWVPWDRIFNVTGEQALREARPAAAVTLALFAARLAIAVPGRVYSAFQEGYAYELWSGGANLLAVGALLAAIGQGAPLPVLLLAFFGTALLGDLGAAAQLFGWSRRWLLPRPRHVDRRVFLSLLRAGAMLWAAQIASVLLLQTDLLVVAQLFGAGQVADYGVSLRLFALVGMVQMAFASALWPAYAEALARQDTRWVEVTFRRSLSLAASWSCAASLGIVALGGWVVRWLVAGGADPGVWLLAAMASTAVVTAVGQSFAMLLNALGEIRIQAVLGMAAGVLNVGASLLLGRWLGPAGVALGTTVAVVASLAVSGRFLAARLAALRAAGQPGTDSQPAP